MGLLNKKSDDQLRFERIAKEMGYEPVKKKEKATWAEVQAERNETSDQMFDRLRSDNPNAHKRNPTSEEIHEAAKQLDAEEAADRTVFSQSYDPYASDYKAEEKSEQFDPDKAYREYTTP